MTIPLIHFDEVEATGGIKKPRIVNGALTCWTRYLDVEDMGGFPAYKAAMRAWGFLRVLTVVNFQRRGNKVTFTARIQEPTQEERYRTTCPTACGWAVGFPHIAPMVIARSIHLREHWRDTVQVEDCSHTGALLTGNFGEIACPACGVVVGTDSFALSHGVAET